MLRHLSIKKILFIAVLFLPSFITAMDDIPMSEELKEPPFSPTTYSPQPVLPSLPLKNIFSFTSKDPHLLSEDKKSFLKECLFLFIPQGLSLLFSKTFSSPVTFQRDIYKVSGMNALFWFSAIAAVKCSETTQNHLQNNQNLSKKDLHQWTTTLPLALCFGTIPSFFLSLSRDQNHWQSLSNTTKKSIKGLAAMGLGLQCTILSYYFNQYADTLSSSTKSFRE